MLSKEDKKIIVSNGKKYTDSRGKKVLSGNI